eukprot:13950531-Alexandrium_andersonii.AAC.1
MSYACTFRVRCTAVARKKSRWTKIPYVVFRRVPPGREKLARLMDYLWPQDRESWHCPSRCRLQGGLHAIGP